MAKLHNALTNAELHNPKGITSNSTASILELNQAQSAISSSADFVPTTNETYDLGSATKAWKEIFVSTSSINFVDPAGNTVQTMKVTPDGVTFTSGSGAVANVSASIISGSSLHIEGGAKVTGDLTLGGKITMGDADSDDVVFEAEVSSSLIPNNDNAFDLGSSSKQWKDIYVNGVGYIDSLGTDGDPVTAYINAGEIDGVTLGGESAVSNITSDGTISGSAVYGTTIGQNRTDGVKTITIEANSTINQDVTTDANPTFAGVTADNVQVGVTAAGELDTSSGNLTIDSAGGTTTIDDILSVAGAATFDSTTTSTGDLSTAGILSGSSEAFIGQYGVNYVSASAGSIQATNYVSGSEIKSPTGTLGSLSVGNVTSTGTITGSAIYGTTIGHNRADGVKTITIEETSIVNQDLTTDANVTFNNVTAATVTGSAIHGTELGQTRNDGVKTITIEANSTVNQDLTSDANVTFGTIASVGNINSTGIISGSSVYGTTIGQTRTDGLKTITIEANSIINQDLSTDADATLGTLGVGNITSTGVVKTSGIISGSDEAFIGQYGVNYVSASNGSLQATNYLSGSHVRASDIQVGKTAVNEIDTAQGNLILDSAGGTVQITDTLDVDGDISLVTQATDIDLIDANTSALSFDAAGKAGILEIDTSDGAEKVKMSGGLDVTGTLSGATISGSSIDGTAIRHNTATGLHSLVLNENLTVSDGQNVVLAAAGQANTLTMNESLTVGDGSSGTITYSAGSKVLTIEDTTNLNQDLTTDANVQFNSLVLDGDLTAQRIIVSSSVANVTQSFSSGSTIFGDTFADDTHQFTGSVAMGNLEVSGTLSANADSLYNIGASGTQFANVFTDNLTLDGQGRVDLDDDLDTSIRASADDVITFEAAGADQLHIKDGTIEPETNDDIALGTTSKMFSDLYLGNGGVVNWNNGNMTVEHAAGVLNVAGGNFQVGGILSGSSEAFFGQYGVSYVSASAGSIQATNYVSGSELKGQSGSFGRANITMADINGGTFDGITSLTAGGNLDIGAHGFRASTLTADSQTDGRVAIYGTAGLLSEDSDLSFSGATLSATNVTSTGTITGSAIYGTTIGQNRVDGTKTITIESNSIVNQDLTTDANVQFAAITGSVVSSSGDVHGGSITSTGNIISDKVDGVISGSSTSTGSFGAIIIDEVIGNWTNAGNTVADLGTVTTVDINGGTIDGVSNVNSTGTITGSAVYGTTIGQNRTDGVKTITIEANSTVNQDLTSDANVTFGTIASVGNITSTGLVKTSGILSGSSEAFIGQYGVSYVSASAGSIQATNYVSGSTGKFNTLDASAVTDGLAAAIVAEIDNDEIPIAKLAEDAVTITAGDGLKNGGSVTLGSSVTVNVDVSDFAGTGIEDDGSENLRLATQGTGISGGGGSTLSITPAQTAITSIYATDLIMGEDSQTAIDFGDTNNIDFKTNNAVDFKMVAGGTFHAEGDVIAYSSTITSDEKFKTNIEDTKYGLDDVMKLRGVDFNWKEKFEGKRDVGFIAQEVQEVLPELVKEVDSIKEDVDETHLTVDYAKVVPVLVESIKELKKEVDSLKVLTEVEELKD